MTPTVSRRLAERIEKHENAAARACRKQEPKMTSQRVTPAELRGLREIERISKFTGNTFVNSASLKSGLNIRAILVHNGLIERYSHGHSFTEYCLTDAGRQVLAESEV